MDMWLFAFMQGVCEMSNADALASVCPQQFTELKYGELEVHFFSFREEKLWTDSLQLKKRKICVPPFFLRFYSWFGSEEYSIPTVTEPLCNSITNVRHIQ